MFNPYQEWLNLPSDGQRPDHYMLLGLPLFEQQRPVIKYAIERQVAAVGQYVATNKEMAQRLLREIEEARLCLMDHSRKAAYDAQLQATLGGGPAAIAANLPSGAPVAALPAGAAPVAHSDDMAHVEDDDDDEELPVANLAEDLLPPGVTPDMSQPATPQMAVPAQPAQPQVAAIPQVQAADAHPKRKGTPLALVLGCATVALLLLIGLGLYFAGVGPFASDEVVADNNDANQKTDADPPRPNADQPAQSPPGNATNDQDSPANTTPANTTANQSDMPETRDGSPTANDSPTELDAATIEAIAENLASARQALANREFALADEKINAAAALDPVGQQRDQIEATRALAAHVGSFWATVRNSVQGLKPADQIEVGGVPIGIIEVDDRGLTVKHDGKNERYDFETMPSQFAYALVLRAFPEDSAAGKLALSAFLIVDPEGNPDRAATMLAQAATDNAETAAMLQAELDIVMLAQADRPTIPEDMTGETSSDPPADNGPVFGVKVAVPGDADVDAAVLALKDEYAEQLQQAQAPMQHLQLMNALVAAAKSEEDPTRRFGLLQLAAEQAGEAQDAAELLSQIELIGDFFEIDVIDVKSGYLARAARWELDRRAPVAQAALDLADDAILQDRYSEAVALARTAQTAARGLGNAELLKNATERVGAFGQLAREERSR